MNQKILRWSAWKINLLNWKELFSIRIESRYPVNKNHVHKHRNWNQSSQEYGIWTNHTVKRIKTNLFKSEGRYLSANTTSFPGLLFSLITKSEIYGTIHISKKQEALRMRSRLIISRPTSILNGRTSSTRFSAFDIVELRSKEMWLVSYVTCIDLIAQVFLTWWSAFYF